MRNCETLKSLRDDDYSLVVALLFTVSVEELVLVAAVAVQGDHKPGEPRVLRDYCKHGKQGILREFCATSYNNQNSFRLIKYLRNKQGIGLHMTLTNEGCYYIYILLR